MKSLEQDALKAQMVIAKSKEGRKRSPLEQLAESPSPAPTPSPTPMEDCSPRNVTSPGRLSMSEKKFDYREFAAIPSSKPVYEIQSPDAADDLRHVDECSNSGKPSPGSPGCPGCPCSGSGGLSCLVGPPEPLTLCCLKQCHVLSVLE
nr:protein scribble homolog [Zonotrichia albicollis]